jgi:hypothetical protein
LTRGGSYTDDPQPHLKGLVGNRILVLLCVIALTTSRAHAWGSTGHGIITDGAMQHLPAQLKVALSEFYSTLRSASTTEPPGNHFIDIDAYPEFFAGTFPRDKNVLIAKYGFPTVQANGESPWSIGDFFASVTQEMQQANTAADRQILAINCGQMAHYIEDIHQPLHCTRNFDGQFTGNSGVHSRYETTMIGRHTTDVAPTASPADCVLLPDIVDHVLDSIDVTYPHVSQIMSADTVAAGSPKTFGNAYYDSMWTSTGDFTRVQFQDASEMVASAWYTAWINAGQPPLVPEPSVILLLVLGLPSLVGRRSPTT